MHDMQVESPVPAPSSTSGAIRGHAAQQMHVAMKNGYEVAIEIARSAIASADAPHNKTAPIKGPFFSH